MKDRHISIIIPTLNEEERLNRLLPYLKKEGGDSIREIIIADAGSSDGTVRIAERNGAKVVLCKRKGRAVQMNEGADEAAGSILYFLHADTLPPQNFYTQITAAFQNGYRCGCFRLSFDDPHPILKFYAWFTRFPVTLFRFGDQSLFVEKKLFHSVGGFDETLNVMEDQKIVRELKKKSLFKVMNASVTTSAKKYKLNGEIRLQCVFILIVTMYYLGASQAMLVDIYHLFISKEDNQKKSS